MRIALFGTGEFALPALAALGDSVALVVTQPDRPSGRGMKLQPSPMKLAALEVGVPVETPIKARDPEFVASIRDRKFDFLLVASYGQILSQALLDSALRGGINLHGSILPKYRGAAPIQRAILNGEATTGVTLMQMDKGMDTGDIIAISTMPINPDICYTTLQDELGKLAAAMILDWAPRICSGEYPRKPQDSNLATVAPKIEKAETELNLTEPAEKAYNRFRAFSSKPGVTLNLGKRGRLRLIDVQKSHLQGQPGEVLQTKSGLVISFHGTGLLLQTVQPEGRKPVAGADWANGARVRVGDNLLESSN